MPAALALTLTLKETPVFETWDVQVERWKTINAFIDTDDVLVHRLVGDSRVSHFHALCCIRLSSGGVYSHYFPKSIEFSRD